MSGRLFSFPGEVSPDQVDRSMSPTILLMVLIGGVETTRGPLVDATVFPQGVVGLIHGWFRYVILGHDSPVIARYPATLPGVEDILRLDADPVHE